MCRSFVAADRGQASGLQHLPQLIEQLVQEAAPESPEQKPADNLDAVPDLPDGEVLQISEALFGGEPDLSP